MASLKNKKGDIEVTLLETKSIKSGDIFIIIDLPPNKPFKTHLFKGPDPKIFEKFVLDLMTFQDDEITLTVKEQKSGGSKFIGQIQIPIKALNLPQGPQWYYLTDRPLKDGQKAKIVTGSLQIQLSFIHRLIRARSRTSIPKEFFQPPTSDTNSPLPSPTTPTTTTTTTQQIIRNVSSSQNNYSTVTSNTSSNSTSSSPSSSTTTSPTSQKNDNGNIEVGFGYPVSISAGGNSSGSDILETQRGESINSRYLVPLVPIDDNQNHGSNSISSSGNGNSNSRINHNQNTEYSKEEDLIIEETIKDKESIVRKQISIQKDNLNKLNETIKQYEKQGKPVVSEKAKLKKMQEDIDDMERLIIVSKSTSTSSSTITGQPIQKVPSKSRIVTTRAMNKSSDKLPPISISTSTSQSNLILSQQQNCNTNNNNGTTSNNLIHASIFNNGSNGISTTSYDVESKLKMFIVELENERRLKESALESYNQLERETMSLKRELATTKTHTSIKSYDELFYRFKILEAENQSLVQEKEILNEKYKLYEKESEKLEKELEYEQSLKRKETEKKEFEREESKKLLKELTQSQSKEKLISMELETQKELADIMREKKQLLERENLQLKQSIKQHQIPITTTKSNQSIEQLQSKIKQLEIEIDFEKKSKSIIQDKLNLAERDQKLIDRLECEIKRLENQIVSLTNLNKSIEKEKSLVVDKFEKEISLLKSSSNNGLSTIENTKNTLVNGTPKQIEEKLNEMVNILVGISQKPDSAAAASIANNKLFDTALGKKIKDISDKIQSATLKNKEMELNLVELRNSKIQNQLDETAAITMINSNSKSNLSSSSSSIVSSTTTPSISSLKNSIGSNNNSPSTSSNDLLMQQQNNQISILVSKLEKLDRLEEFIRKLDDMKQFQFNQSSNNLLAGGSGGAPVKRNHLHMKSEMEEIQKIILNDKISDKERDDANVKFEKLFQELSMTEEYRKEIQQIQEDKRRLNEPLNQKSLLKILPLLQTTAFKDRIKDNPELSLIGMDPKAILSKHQNDFQSFLLRCLPIDELRAIRASLPKFRSDQKKQIEWTLTLEEKIDQVSKLPNPPPNFKNQKPKLIIKTTKLPPTPPPLNKNGKPSQQQQPSGHQNLLGELLKKRSKIQ